MQPAAACCSPNAVTLQLIYVNRKHTTIAVWCGCGCSRITWCGLQFKSLVVSFLKIYFNEKVTHFPFSFCMCWMISCTTIALSLVPHPEIKLLWRGLIILGRWGLKRFTNTFMMSFKTTLQRLIGHSFFTWVEGSIFRIRIIKVFVIRESTTLKWKASWTTLQTSSPIMSQ